MRRRGFKRPGEFRKTNQHGGRLWASRKECNMTNKAAGDVYAGEHNQKLPLIQKKVEK